MRAFGLKVDDLKTATLFLPQAKSGEEPQFDARGTNFSKPYDKLEAGFAELSSHQSDCRRGVRWTLAVLLVGLDEKAYGKPQPAGARGR